jgi:signal transduction histidine kinase
VVNNLITNAIKFSFLGTTIQVTISINDKFARIQVKDEGIGIPTSVQPQIFEMFTSAKRHGTVGERSYGLGLSICKQIVEELGGRIWFESVEAKGSSFFVELPLVGR